MTQVYFDNGVVQRPSLNSAAKENLMYIPTMGRPLPELLQELRRAAGLSIEDFSQRCGVAKSTIYRIESGDLPGPLEALELYGELARQQQH